MASSIKGRPVHATLWFNLAITAAVLFVLFIATRWQDTIRIPQSVGQVIVCVLAAYWLLVYPRLRKISPPPAAGPPVRPGKV